jgi:hypothetical protein
VQPVAARMLGLGPLSYTSSVQNPNITNASLAQAGIYTVTTLFSGCAKTATTNVVVNTCTGVEESEVLSEILVYPNPACTYFTLSNVVEGTSVNVIDVTGKVVISNSVIDTDRTMTIETSNLSNGIYIDSIKK